MLLNYHIGRFVLDSLCVGDWCGRFCVVPVLQASACNTDITQTQLHQISNTTNREQNDRCGNVTAQSQAPDGGYINVQYMLST